MRYPNAFTTIAVVLLLPIAYSAKAQLQDAYVAGSIILNDNEKLTGFINDRPVEKMNEGIAFKSALKHENPTLYPASLVKEVTLMDEDTYEQLHFEPYSNKDTVVALARLLVKGKASLYEVYYKSEELFLITNKGKTYTLEEDKDSSEIIPSPFTTILQEALADSIGLINTDHILFDQQEITKLVSSYNVTRSSESDVTVEKLKSKHFIIATLNGMVKSKTNDGWYIEGVYRMYFPKISRSFSFNAGLNYFNYRISDVIDNISYRISLLGIPFQLQENILNKNIRPYLFIGATLNFADVNQTYWNASNHQGQGALKLQDNRFENISLLDLSFGAGVEADIYKGFLIKTSYLFEGYAPFVALGIGYNFSWKQ